MLLVEARESRGQMNAARQDKILRRYGLPAGTHPDYEIDHLIPLCLGGSDDDSNLWPQPRRSMEGTWNAEAKDRLERLMCNMVCEGQIDIATAQEAFATDWIAAYLTYYEGRRKRPRQERPLSLDRHLAFNDPRHRRRDHTGRAAGSPWVTFARDDRPGRVRVLPDP